MAFHPLFNTHPQYWYVSKFLEDSTSYIFYEGLNGVVAFTVIG